MRVHLAGICSTDLQIVKGYMGFTGILGHEFVGTVEEGPDTWKGKRVVGEINCVCRTCHMCTAGLSNHCPNRTVIGIDGRNGCFADRLAIPAANLHEVPENLHDEQAVFAEPLAAAFQVLSQCHIDSRMQVALVGPGRLGLLVAQVLHEQGCRLRVYGRNQDKLQRCEKKGIQATHVDDIREFGAYDVVVDCSGSPSGLRLSLSLVRPRGTLVLKSTYADTAIFEKPRRDAALDSRPDSPAAPQNSDSAEATVNLALAVINEITIVGSRCGPFPEAIHALSRESVEVRSLITRTFPLDQALDAFTAAADRRHVKVLLKM